MAGLEKVEEIRFPATLTTKDGLTHSCADANELSASGLASKSWEHFRGGYREVGTRAYKDGRESVGRKKMAEAKAKSEVKRKPPSRRRSAPSLAPAAAPPPTDD